MVAARLALLACASLACIWTIVPTAAAARQSNFTQVMGGEVLPILPPKQPPITEPDWRKVPQPKPFVVRPPKNAPDVVIVLLDQTAYADPSTFGGPINFPTLDRLAREGLTYTNFHVNSLCSPSRSALQTGRNQHQNSMAAVVDGATSRAVRGAFGQASPGRGLTSAADVASRAPSRRAVREW